MGIYLAAVNFTKKEYIMHPGFKLGDMMHPDHLMPRMLLYQMECAWKYDEVFIADDCGKDFPWYDDDMNKISEWKDITLCTMLEMKERFKDYPIEVLLDEEIKYIIDYDKKKKVSDEKWKKEFFNKLGI